MTGELIEKLIDAKIRLFFIKKYYQERAIPHQHHPSFRTIEEAEAIERALTIDAEQEIQDLIVDINYRLR